MEHPVLFVLFESFLSTPFFCDFAFLLYHFKLAFKWWDYLTLTLFFAKFYKKKYFLRFSIDKNYYIVYNTIKIIANGNAY